MKRNRIRLSTKVLIALLLLVAMLIPLTGYTSDLDEELISAARDGNTDTVKALLAKGADVNAKDSAVNTALIAAAWRGHSDVAKALLEKGADVTPKNSDGVTALGVAEFAGQTEIIGLLKEAGAKE